ncbi:MAG: DUF116 domain-containing protein [Syntrophomonadaceae bacterium]|nr:DUF116 domain-containing protein [Syntrophomonadaceae bacterium]
MNTRKRLYVGLLVASLFFLAGLLAGGWYLLTNRNIMLNRVILLAALVAVVSLFAVIAGGILAIVVAIARSKTIPPFDGIMRLANQVLFPVAVFLGRTFGIDKERVWRSFIAVNNSLVRAQKNRVPLYKLMILVPHCLQNSECPHKITANINNCKKCGKCCIKDLIELADRYRATLKVATGGTLARKYISEVRPQGVVAIACERDLSQGIQDAGVVPVMGVLNSRPNGPCLNTEVSIDEVEKAIETILKGGT